MDEILFGVLAESVGRYLESVDRLAASQQAAVRSELRRMSAAWRALLDTHRPAGARARCSGCSPGRRGRSARGAMCGVWRVASAYFTVRLPGEDPAEHG